MAFLFQIRGSESLSIWASLDSIYTKITITGVTCIKQIEILPLSLMRYVETVNYLLICI